MEVASNLNASKTCAPLQQFAKRGSGQLAFQGNAEEEMAKLIASLGGGDLQLSCTEQENTQRLIDSGAATPVQEFIDQENYDLSTSPEAHPYYTVDGKLWPCLLEQRPHVVLQQGHFREVGLDPENPPKDIENCGRPRRRW